MSRKRRRCPGGIAYHIMNRATAREQIFATPSDYAAFERVLAEAREREAERVRLCAYVLMPNHFHLVLWPQLGADAAVTSFMKWLTMTHAQRWHAHRHSAGTGALYGSRFRSFPVQEDAHFLKACRYVERNPLRAGLVARAEHWPWGSLHRRQFVCPPPSADQRADVENSGALERPSAAELLDGWPVPAPPDWLERVNEPGTAAELEALRRCIQRGCPFGEDRWVASTAAHLGLEASLRPKGRPRKPWPATGDQGDRQAKS
jgi:putative transposase